MDEIDRAIAITEKMRAALTTEVDGAREQRLLIRKMDADGLFARAQKRAAFNVLLAQLEMELAEHLGRAGRSLGLAEVTMDALRALRPSATKRLAERFGQVRALAGALHELDTLNRALAERALSVVRGYVTAMTGVPTAYDRHGGIATGSGSPLSTANRVA